MTTQPKVRTVEDLEKKYNFAKILGLTKNVEKTASSLTKIENELNGVLNTLVINLADVLDSQSDISLWFYSGAPTTLNEPYVLWDNPTDHIGDFYYDKSSGFVYKWNGVWEINSNPDLVEAMALTNAATDTTEDHERKVFFNNTPTPPYAEGDWWVKENGSLSICQIPKASGTYEAIDFTDSSNYVENFAEKIGEELRVLKGTVTMITDNYAKFTDLETGGSTIIAGENISTGNIQSNNYVVNESGMRIALNNGTIDTKRLKTDEEGNIILYSSNLYDDEASALIINSTRSPQKTANYGGDGINLKSASGSILLQLDNPHSEVLQNAILHMAYGNSKIQLNVDDDAYIDVYGADKLEASPIYARMTHIGLDVYDNTTSSYTTTIRKDKITTKEVTAQTYNNTSLESAKKNIEKLETSGLNEVLNTDIYKYNFKTQKNGDKKHIGFVIGDDYKYSHEITSLNEKNKEIGVDIYSMIAMSYKAIQEQQEIIESLKKEIKELKKQEVMSNDSY